VGKGKVQRKQEAACCMLFYSRAAFRFFACVRVLSFTSKRHERKRRPPDSRGIRGLLFAIFCATGCCLLPLAAASLSSWIVRLTDKDCPFVRVDGFCSDDAYPRLHWNAHPVCIWCAARVLCDKNSIDLGRSSTDDHSADRQAVISEPQPIILVLLLTCLADPAREPHPLYSIYNQLCVLLHLCC
jgi:hypothetical protein